MDSAWSDGAAPFLTPPIPHFEATVSAQTPGGHSAFFPFIFQYTDPLLESIMTVTPFTDEKRFYDEV